MEASNVGARLRDPAMRRVSVAWPSPTAGGWRKSSADRGEVAAVLNPFASAYAGIDPAIIAPLLRWAWLRASGSDLHPAAVSAAATAISERRFRRDEMRM